MRSRALALVTGLGALAALVVVAVLGWRAGGGDGDGPVVLPGLPASAMTVGLQDERLTIAAPEEIAARLDRLKATGIAMTRVDVAWSQVAPAKPADAADPQDPAYSWERTDATLDGLRDRNITAIVTFSQTPAWVNGGKAPEWMTSVDDYGAFVRAFATRYSGGQHAAVRLYEPWNEPNNGAMLMPQREGSGANATLASAPLYAKMLERARTEIQAASPDAAVVGLALADVPEGGAGESVVGVDEFLAALGALAPKMDAASVHLTPIGPPAESSIARLPRVIEQIDKLAPGADVLVTAVGYSTQPGGATDQDQARWLTESLELLSRTPRVRLAVWYSVQDTLERPSGLLTADGTEKPSWAVFVGAQKSVPTGTP